MDTQTASRIHAALFSVAICDALGGPGEFRARDSYTITTFIRNENFSLPPGTPTDDTSLTLCLASSLLSTRRCDLAHQATTYLSWYRNGQYSATGRCFDIGHATRRALELWEAGKGDQVERELGSERFRGNGSLMRVLPVALVAYQKPELAEEWARVQSTVTHPDKVCQEACAVYTMLVGGILRGDIKSKEEVATRVDRWRYTSMELRECMFGVGKRRREEVRSSGYVVHTLQAAVWGFLTTDSFKDGALKAVNLGDDADTVGAVYGGLAGAWYGNEDGCWWEDEVVQGWKEELKMKDVLQDLAYRMVEAGGKAWVA